MDKQNIRLFFLLSLVIVGTLLYSSWQHERPGAVSIPTPQTKNQELNFDHQENNLSNINDINISGEELEKKLEKKIPQERLIFVKTDVFNLKIDMAGGDIVYMDLPKYPQQQNDSQGFILLDQSRQRYYIAQSGLLSEIGPDSNTNGRAIYQAKSRVFELQKGDGILNVDLNYTTDNGVKITKRFIFKRSSYLIDVQYIINNNSPINYNASMFGRLKRKPESSENHGFMGAMRTYTGAAVSSSEARYKKITFNDMDKKVFKESIIGSWAAMVEHYFTTAWVPDGNQLNNYQSEKIGTDQYGIRFVGTPITVKPGEKKVVKAKLYAGPEITEILKNISPGLELTVDYGVLWWLCQPIFLLLKWIYGIVGNWGAAIVLITIVIKLLFYKLSATSYRSMGKMRKIQPQLESLKERYKDNKQQFAQAMMGLYKKEKINPVGGCFPILIQIPVFIALYWVLLESVELRQTPFILWIKDLSAKDPYYVLPIIMGISMFVQQKLNPPPPDPIQAKIMLFMPIFFTVLFFQFPAGLVLYWVVNNVLSIIQQWVITRGIE